MFPLCLYLVDADATARLGQWFAARLQAGDCLLLEGQIGAGKSHFARAFIQARLGRAEDVPSPPLRWCKAIRRMWRSGMPIFTG